MKRTLKERIRWIPQKAQTWPATGASSLLALGGQPMMRNGVLAIMDQALISGTNFLTVLLVARAVAPSQFGIFVLAYTGLWFFQNAQRALIVEPMNVLGAAKEGHDYRAYVTSTAALQAVFAAVLASALLVLGALLPSARSLLLALSLAVGFWQLQEFVRRVFYTRTRVGAALINDGISYGGQAVLLTTLYVQGLLTPASALVAIAVTSAIAAAVGGWGVRSEMSTELSLHSVRQAAASNWRFGRWLAGGKFLSDGGHQLYLVLLAALVGPAGVGAFAAASTVARVNNVLILALDTLLPPVASRRFRQNSLADMESFLKWATLVAGIPAILVLSLLLVFAEEALHVAYGGAYDEFALVLRLVSLASLLFFLSVPLNVALKAIDESKVLFLSGVASAAVLVTGGSLLAVVAGVTGAAWVAVLAAVIALAVRAIGYWNVTRRRSAIALVMDRPSPLPAGMNEPR